jgi:hypothetical protein
MNDNVKRWTPERIVVLAGPRVRHHRRDLRDRERGERVELERLAGGERTAVRRERPGRRPQRGAAMGPAAGATRRR